MPDLLTVEGLGAGYGAVQVLRDVSLTLGPGEGLAVLGRNGAGKTTLIETLMGLTTRFAGRVTLGGRDLTALPPEARAAAGLGWVPQGRRVFRSLSVAENLTATARPGPWTQARVEALFPRLAERRAQPAGALSAVSTTCPRARISARSVSASACRACCSTITIAMPSARRPASTPASPCTTTGASPSVGSSSSRQRAPVRRMRAMSR